jgi:hypothetical protein
LGNEKLYGELLIAYYFSIMGRISSVIERILREVRAFRNQQLYKKLFEPDRRELYSKLYLPNDEPRILSGPFAGMKYINTPAFGPISPKWLGSYEWEIQDLIDQFCVSEYETIVDVGSADGYYAVGLAWRSRNSRVIAYDIDPFARRATRRLAVINGVADRLAVRTSCNWSDLDRLPQVKKLLLVDIEGAEIEFLDPHHCSSLKGFDILVEVHEKPEADLVNGIEKALELRFRETHIIRRRPISGRVDWCAKNNEVWSNRLTSNDLYRATNEFRTINQVWLWLQIRV